MVSKTDTHLDVHLSSGIGAKVDLTKMHLTDEQHRVLGKAANALSNASDETLTGACPAQTHLTPSEFNQIRDLKHTIGSDGGQTVGAFIIVDFCLHFVKPW